MSWVQGSLSKTGGAKGACYYPPTDGTLAVLRAHPPGEKKGSLAANASRWNAIINVTVSGLRSALTASSLLYVFFKLVGEMIYL